MTTPLHWSYSKLGKFGEFAKGSGIKKSEVTDSGIPCVRYGEIYTHHGTTIKSFNSFIQPEVAKNSVKLKQNDILFACSGETKEEIGKSTVFTGTQEAYAGGDIIILSPDGVDSVFLGYALQSSYAQRQKARSGKGDAVVHISAKDLSEIQILLPNEITEQKAIAEALSDIDELIHKSKLLLDKKQKLFDAQCADFFNSSKLANFENCKSQKLGTLCDVTTGKKDVNEGTVNGRYPFFTCSTKHFWSDNFSFDTEAILIAGNGDVGNLHYYNGKFEAYQRTYVCTNFNLNTRYIWFFLKYALAENLGLNKVGSTIPYIVLSQLTEFEVLMPEEETQLEQIVDTLEVATQEIELLSDELAKYEWLKQGMMNDLLTGKVRLA